MEQDYRARYYNPAIGRFISEDPIGLGSGTTNFYGYAENSPTDFDDPFGEATTAPPPPVEAPVGEPPVKVAPPPVPLDPVVPPWLGPLATGVGIIYYLGDPGGSGDWPNSQEARFEHQCKKRRKKDDCDEMYKMDLATCRQVKMRSCYDQAMQRYAACTNGDPIPPFPYRRPN